MVNETPSAWHVLDHQCWKVGGRLHVMALIERTGKAEIRPYRQDGSFSGRHYLGGEYALGTDAQPRGLSWVWGRYIGSLRSNAGTSRTKR